MSQQESAEMQNNSKADVCWFQLRVAAAAVAEAVLPMVHLEF